MTVAQQEWIRAYGLRFPGSMIMGRCQEAAREMLADFPELRVECGYVLVPPPWGKRGHWWLVAPDGEVVDPTADQFPAVLSYEPWRPGDEVRVGKCMNCGVEIWEPIFDVRDIEQRKFCNKACDEAFAGDLRQVLRSAAAGR